MTKMLNPGNINAFLTFFAQSTTYTEIYGEMPSEQFDHDQRIKPYGIFAASVIIIGQNMKKIRSNNQ